MSFNSDIESFIKDFVKDLNEGAASIFVGAGMSVPAGYVNWSELLDEIATDLKLDIKKETDLISIAQFHVNENHTRSKLNRIIIEEFTRSATETRNHRIIARLPLLSVWTTNYDKLIERAFRTENKVIDVKYNNNQLLTTKPKRDTVIYKMHGDVDNPNDAILTKEQYEKYHINHQPFINALTGELTTKTFLFIGFSFTDPNLDYVLSRLNFQFPDDKRQHFCFVKKHCLGDDLNPDQATLDYNQTKQSLVMNDLKKRYGIKSLIIDNYNEITDILTEIEYRYKQRTIFISGSAETYAPYEQNEALGFINNVAKVLIENDFRIVNGFGWGIGSSVINGALEAIYSDHYRYSEDQLILRPFPQHETGEKKLKELWEEYRHRMISMSGISLFFFGNKKSGDDIVEANGVIREFEISHENGNICIPIGLTGYAATKIYDIISKNPDKFYKQPVEIMKFLNQLADNKIDFSKALTLITSLFKKLKK